MVKTASIADLERQRLKSLINSMTDGVVAVDSTFKVVLCNGAALNLLDINNLGEGTPLSDVLKLIDKNNKDVTLAHLVKKDNTATISRDHRMTYQDGSLVNLYISIAPVHLGYGKSGDQGYVVVLRDITHEKSLEEERDEFISVVSHELRTPIAIAEGNLSNAQLIAEKHVKAPEITGSLQQAYDQVTFLSGMINDLSMLSRAEHGKLAMETADINIRELVSELQKLYEPQAQEKGLDLHISLDPKLELLHSSRLYIREILQNFVTNAIKYTDKGSVTMGAKALPDGVMLSVQDTGIGISKHDQEKVFNKFFRSEDFRTRQHNGTGLGLYVTAKLAKLLRAKISLESAIDKGSIFYIAVPNFKKK
jgi:two-component system phosphate regulon sensor histidine kinase PhoR